MVKKKLFQIYQIYFYELREKVNNHNYKTDADIQLTFRR